MAVQAVHKAIMSRNITAGFLPWWPQNPYQILLKQELNKLGVRVIGNPPLSLLRLLIGRDGLDVVHVHWPHGIYTTPFQFLHVLIVLIAYRVLKNNVVWTVHELDAYESRFPRIDTWLRAVLMKLCRHLIVHGEYTRCEIVAKYRFPRAISIVRHPSYTGWYKDDIDRTDARHLLGLPAHSRVFLYFGYIKPYKGVEELIDAFRTVQDPQAILLIAGKPLDDDIKRQIESLASADPRIRTHLRFIPDEEIQNFFRAADIVVFPFRQTQTSGSLMLALTYGCPVIAPSIATLPEYIDTRSSILFDPQKPNDLARALRDAEEAPLASMAAAAKLQGEAYSWHDMASVHLACYRSMGGDT
ncbi:MAG: glycosyltransferase family 4 protein [Sulfuriferula multivorans]|uniref:Glycosyltransferase family 4 protein n=1 Tax=Sulfuriferula multivorans TaxID=1559896 RepID=A0A7C9P2E8_9PROT|nr:glycosyltransferase family 4 protein [Sulfuriferula multivorans]